MILLDTQVLVWLNVGTGRLGRRARKLIDEAWKDRGLAVSAISFWECTHLIRLGRIELPEPVAAWRQALLEAGLVEYALDGATAVRAETLDDLPKDPADRFITATAMERGAALLTSDESLLRARHVARRYDARL